MQSNAALDKGIEMGKYGFTAFFAIQAAAMFVAYVVIGSDQAGMSGLVSLAGIPVMAWCESR